MGGGGMYGNQQGVEAELNLRRMRLKAAIQRPKPFFPGLVADTATTYGGDNPLKITSEQAQALYAHEALGAIFLSLTLSDEKSAQGIENEGPTIANVNTAIGRAGAKHFRVAEALELSREERELIKLSGKPGYAADPSQYSDADRAFVHTYSALLLAPEITVIKELFGGSREEREKRASKLIKVLNGIKDNLRPEYYENGMKFAAELRDSGIDSNILNNLESYVDKTFKDNLLKGHSLGNDLPFLTEALKENDIPEEVLPAVQKHIDEGNLAEFSKSPFGSMVTASIRKYATEALQMPVKTLVGKIQTIHAGGDGHPFSVAM